MNSSMNKLKVIIVDDEQEAREGMALLLQQDPSVHVAAICSNGLEALEAVRHHQPDLLLLDIQMPQVNGFEVLNSLDETTRPAVIFVTAYDEYALKAFEVHAVDYLLKPFTDQRFFAALQHARALIDRQHGFNDNHQLTQLLKAQQPQEAPRIIHAPLVNDRLPVKADGNIHLIPLQDLIKVTAYDYYIKLHTGSHTFVVRDSMKNMENTLPASQFVRIHKSAIINIQYLTDMLSAPQGETTVQLKSGEQLRVSRSYKDRLKSMIG